MNPEITYAIVDIEATGSSMNSNEKIIQFACVLYQNGKILQEFDTLVQPERSIPPYITRLTGISNQDVKGAPYFEEIAPLIAMILHDTVFVAHNVGFDFKFLNEQLENYGFPALKNKAIDTVQLAQILWPQSPNYALEDLAELLEEPFDHAHNALFDARMTVKLLHAMWEKAVHLPSVTLHELSRLSNDLIFDTSDFFTDARAFNESCDDDFKVVDHLAFAPYEYPLIHRVVPRDYPKEKAEKEKIFRPPFEKRINQWHMMDLIYENFSKKEGTPIAIEAPAGIGKTLGYLFPMSFFIDDNTPLIISTQTTLLQEQIKKTIHYQLNPLTGFDFEVAIVKSANHYLNVERFAQWIARIDANDRSAFSCMRILVWLTETYTGDIEEIGYGSEKELELWDMVTGESYSGINPYWSQVDFLARRRWKINHAHILVTNHTFLCHDWSSEYPLLKSDTLTIFDESHHMPDIVLKQSLIQFDAYKMDQLLNHLLEIIDEFSVRNRMNPDEYHQVNFNLKWQLEAFSIYFGTFEKYLTKLPLTQKRNGRHEYDVNMIDQTLDQKRLYREIIKSGTSLLKIINKVLKRPIKNEYHYRQHRLYIQNKLIKICEQYQQYLYNFREIFLAHGADKYQRWLSVITMDHNSRLVFKMAKTDKNHLLFERLKANTRQIYTSSSLSKGESIAYLADSLRLTDLAFYRVDSEYCYFEQSLVLLPDSALYPKKLVDDYAKDITCQLEKILMHTHRKALVLFQSLDLMNCVYDLLIERENLQHYQLLAQGKSGSRLRILKRFKRNKPTLLLGSHSFSEGLDLPHDQLEVIILPRLPFDSPELPIFEIYEHAMLDKNKRFKEILLPRAVMRLKQIFGRLIRSKKDKGLLIILDKRYQTARYKKSFIQAIPSDTPQIVQTLDTMHRTIEKYFK
ncbi:helicase C-terminal domain-containing protein [Allofustis seminis]|uniref:helicase C-terminal domain-containing protein n=1 Tax=Allofustis seminis TaxID=166939 RepID=UPI000376427A|nr:helicase C-terminal domain-containing protein [Allofustis seminis]